MSETASGQEGGRADVELRLPADGAYVSVLRTTTAGLAARLDFTIDDIEDLRIAVGEASAMVLPEADEGSDLVSTFHVAPGKLTIARQRFHRERDRARLRQLRLAGADHPGLERRGRPGGRAVHRSALHDLIGRRSRPLT